MLRVRLAATLRLQYFRAQADRNRWLWRQRNPKVRKVATLIPSRNTCLPRMTGGERRFAARLEDKLEDDYLVWYDVPIGPRRRQPDFVIVHPARGLLVLEVKDWKLDHLHSLDRRSAVLRGEHGQKVVPNPLLQARDYALEVLDLLQRDPALRHPAGHAHAGQLALPWGHGVVLAGISRAAFDANDMGLVIPEHQVICQDEMVESADAESFQQRLWSMLLYRFGQLLSLPQIDRIRWHLFPEIRVQPPLQTDLFGATELFAAGHGTEPIPELIRVMDLQQEQLARSLGEGHRVIHGVAGSGKTMILGYRCLQLARSQAKPILVICFNRTLAARLRQVIAGQALQARVVVQSFHAWCAAMLRTYHVAVAATADHGDGFAAQVDAVIAAVERGQIPRGQYGAVLVDEGHDFEPHWLRLIVQMVDPATRSLLLLYDDAQSVYAKSSRRKISFARLGIEARGRTTILRLNYRNTWEVLAFAKAFAAELFEGDASDEDTPAHLAPEGIGRHGPMPCLLRCRSRDEEAELIAARIDALIARGVAPSQIAVLWRHAQQTTRLAAALDSHRIASFVARDGQSKDTLFLGEPSVKLVSMYSSKGLEFDHVFIPALDQLRAHANEAAAEDKLLYVAMTRAMQGLVMSCVQNGGAVPKVAAALAAVANQAAAA